LKRDIIEAAFVGSGVAEADVVKADVIERTVFELKLLACGDVLA